MNNVLQMAAQRQDCNGAGLGNAQFGKRGYDRV